MAQGVVRGGGEAVLAGAAGAANEELAWFAVRALEGSDGVVCGRCGRRSAFDLPQITFCQRGNRH